MQDTASNARSVLFLETGESGGGSFRSLHILLEHIDRTRFFPVVALTADQPGWRAKYSALGYPVYTLYNPEHSPQAPRLSRSVCRRLENACRFLPSAYPAVARRIFRETYARLREIIRAHAVRLIYDNDQINRNLFCTVLANDEQLPLVSHLRSFPQKDFFPFKAATANSTVRCFIANSAATAEAWTAKGIARERVTTLHNAVAPLLSPESDSLDEPQTGAGNELQNECPNGFRDSLPHKCRKTTHSALREIFGNERMLDDTHFVLAVAARLVPLKRIDLLIRAVAALRSRHPLLRAIIIGDGEARRQLEALAKSEGIDDIIRFTGWRDDAPRLMQLADCSVLPSESEAFGLSIVESMLLGVPVIGANAGGIAEIIEHERTGLLFTSGSDDDLARNIERFVEDAMLRTSCAQEAKREAQRRFSPVRHIQRVEGILEDALRDSQ